MGPLLFSIFSNDLALYCEDATIYQFADDTQVLVVGKKRHIHDLIARLERALDSISKWFSSHAMKVNTAKTQLIVFGSKGMLRGFPKVTVKFGSSVLSESESVRNLGLVMDRYLSFDVHIDQLVGRCTGVLVALSHARHCLPSDVIADVVNCLVTSSIRYCISIYATSGQTPIKRIQKLINFCARVICGKRKYDHISAEIKRLGWLSAEQLVLYHRLCMIRKVLLTGHPPGIAEYFTTVSHSHDTRALGQLARPQIKNNAGKRRLCFSGADAYNQLPMSVREVGLPLFKARLVELLLRDDGG